VDCYSSTRRADEHHAARAYVVTGTMLAVGPQIDDAESWTIYRRSHPDSRYATAKRVLSRRELRRHGLRNSATG
jgi:hypothetical protein